MFDKIIVKKLSSVVSKYTDQNVSQLCSKPKF